MVLCPKGQMTREACVKYSRAVKKRYHFLKIELEDIDAQYPDVEIITSSFTKLGIHRDGLTDAAF